MTTSPSMMICRVCRRVLDAYTKDETTLYLHTVSELLSDPVDHEPIPIPMPADYREGRCDFCNNDRPMGMLPVRDFPMPGMPGLISRGEWATCASCAHLIEMNRWRDLIARAVSVKEGREQRTITEVEWTALRAAYRAVRRNITGTVKHFD